LRGFDAKVPSPSDPTAFSLLGVDIRWYALFMVAGIVAGIALSRALASRLGLDRDWLLDAAPWVILAAIVGARAYYVALRGEYFLSHPLDAINIRLGGMAFHGSLVAGTLAFAYLCRRNQQPFWKWSDAIIPGVALAQAVGRWGNWANQEAFGTPTDLPWGLAIDATHRPPQYVNAERFHPTFLYESLFDLANAALLSWLAFRVRRSRVLVEGDILGIYLINYGIGRFLIERLRTDSLYLGPLPAAYWLSWALIAAGIAVLAFRRRFATRATASHAESLSEI
jgi:phosphatidylglycerol:prolipoprotein diacylglycerol transferase